MGGLISRLVECARGPAPPTIEWDVSFLNPSSPPATTHRALIILNQPFARALLHTLWTGCTWRCCADGGANRLFDLFGDDDDDARSRYLPDLIEGDLDSLRDDVRAFYAARGVPVVQDADQDTTDLDKCVRALERHESAGEGAGARWGLVVLGGLSGRLDQTVHTLACVHRLRQTRARVWVVDDANVAWVLDEGTHRIRIDHGVVGPTCGLLPVGVASTTLSTAGLRWNLEEMESSFDGLVSTSNHLVPGEEYVTVRTSRPIWWCAELRRTGDAR